MTSAQAHHARSKFAILLYFATCFLTYGIGRFVSGFFHASAVGVILVDISGLLILFTCPGLLLSLMALCTGLCFTESLVAGVASNLIILPGILILMAAIRVPPEPGLLIGMIALLTFLVGARSGFAMELALHLATSGEPCCSSCCAQHAWLQSC